MSMKVLALVLGILSGGVGTLSSLALIKGGSPVPWGIQSYGGQTADEVAHRASTACWTKVGLTGLILAFVLSALSAVAGYLS
jgi:hypothetical protein